MNKWRAGFTLLELSIVLVIVGLLVGGVLAGRNLIRNAEVNSVLTEYESFDSAVSAFRTQYDEIPGDFTRATQLWGAATDCNYTSGAVSSGKATCDGDGDGIVGGLNTVRQWEYQMFWQHLSNSGLLKGGYNGFLPWEPGETSPSSTLKNATWRMMGEMWGTLCFMQICSDNFLTLDSLGGAMNGGVLTPEELYLIDQKLDDGMPSTGVISTAAGSTTCTQAPDGGNPVQSSATNQYRLSNTNKDCSLFIVKPFE